MSKVLAFSGSLSKQSVNHQFIEYAASLIKEHEVNVIRLGDFPMPLYTKEKEADSGIPESTQRLRKLFDETDAFLISTPEYNSSIPAGLKNTLDWISRKGAKIFQDKLVLLMAATPGKRGGRSVLDHLSRVMPFWGADLVGTFSLPRFKDNFADGKLVNQELHNSLTTEIQKFTDNLK